MEPHLLGHPGNRTGSCAARWNDPLYPLIAQVNFITGTPSRIKFYINLRDS